MHSLEEAYLARLRFSADQISTLKRIGEFRGMQELFTRQTPEVLESLKKVAMVESSESSNRLEGITAPHERIEAIVLKSAAPQDRSEQEITGYRDALNLIHEAHAHVDLSNNVILQLHAMVQRYLPRPGGNWKLTDNEIVDLKPDGSRRVRFKPVLAAKTPQAMDLLMERYRRAVVQDQKEPLVALPLAILDFLCIHPFSDGNGRVSRLLTLLLLYRFDFQVGRYISLERIFEESKETYYETLEKSSQGWHEGKHDVMPWLNYFWGVLLRAYGEFEERVGTVKDGRGNKTEQVRLAVGRRTMPFAISDIESDCHGISRDMIRLVLRQMRDKGEITSTGKGRGAKWVKKG